MRDTCAVAEIDKTGCNRNIGERDLLSAEHQTFFRQPIADTSRPNGPARTIDYRTAANADGNQIRHAKKCADSTDMDDGIGFPWKALPQMAEISGRAADIGNDRVIDPRQVCSSSHRIGCAGCKTEDRECSRTLRFGYRSIILSNEQWGS